MKPDVYFHFREAKRGSDLRIGPGKVALLEAIAKSGSITAAAKSLGMSYRRAWILVDETNRCLIAPAVKTAIGGNRGGGTVLTSAGSELVRRYRKLEAQLAEAVDRELKPIFRSSSRTRNTPASAGR